MPKPYKTLYLDIDFETRSEISIMDHGAAKYAKHPSTQILMISFSMNGKQIANWNPHTKPIGYVKLIRYIKTVARKKHYRIRAHHAEFEYWIWNEVATKQFGWPKLPMSKFYCTQSLAGANSYPGSLEKAGMSMNLVEQKDAKVGKTLISFFCNPSRKKDEHFKEPLVYLSKFQDFIGYCDQDVLTQMHIVDHCKPLTPFQIKILDLTEKMNVRGLPIDREMCEGAIRLVDKYKKRADKRLSEITGGEITSASQTVKLTQWLNDEKGAAVPNLKAETIVKVLKRKNLDDDVKEVLVMRSNVSKTSTAKYAKALALITDDDLVHGFIKAYLTITGRWAGRGLQIQNFSKPAPDFPRWCDYEYLVQLIRDADIDTIEFFYGDVMAALKAATRSMIRAKKGYKFICADYSQIEARIVMWLAGSRMGLQDFSGDGKIYEKMSAQIFSKNVKDIAKGSFERDVGKETVLGCGFGMGVDKFFQRCTNDRNLSLTKDIAQFAVTQYRVRYPEVKKAWNDCEEAAKNAIMNKGLTYYACNRKLHYLHDGNTLACRLPSGRSIYYPAAKIDVISKPWGPTEVVCYKNWKDTRPAGKKWDWEDTWGGTLFQHAVQGTAGDVMANGMLNAEEANYPALFTVHDESLAMVKDHFGTVKEYEELLCRMPLWAEGMPIVAEGWEGPIYKK